METVVKQTFASLRVRNFRLYFMGQGLSLCGTWAQTIAISWLILQLTHSGTQLGLVTAAQFLPIFILGVWGGVIADRFSKRKLLYYTQTTAGVIALILGLLVATHHIHVWEVYALSALLGLSMVVDNPTRQTFVMEMVGQDLIKNAVTLNSMMVNLARVVGPSIAGILIATVGVGPCFLINAASYLAVLAALMLMRKAEFHPAVTAGREPGQVRAGLKYVWHTPVLRSTLLMMLIIGTFAYEFPVVLPLFATAGLHGNASTYSLLTAAMGIGAVIAGLYAAGRHTTTPRSVIKAAIWFGLSLLLATITPNRMTAYIALMIVGGLSVLFISQGNTVLQLTSTPQMRGRVMALWTIAFLGTTPIGGPIVGFISDHTNPRAALAVGGVSALLAAGLGLYLSRPSTAVQQ